MCVYVKRKYAKTYRYILSQAPDGVNEYLSSAWKKKSGGAKDTVESTGSKLSWENVCDCRRTPHKEHIALSTACLCQSTATVAASNPIRIAVVVGDTPSPIARCISTNNALPRASERVAVVQFLCTLAE